MYLHACQLAPFTLLCCCISFTFLSNSFLQALYCRPLIKSDCEDGCNFQIPINFIFLYLNHYIYIISIISMENKHHLDELGVGNKNIKIRMVYVIFFLFFLAIGLFSYGTNVKGGVFGPLGLVLARIVIGFFFRQKNR